MHILVTGGAGFIGTNFTRQALASGHRVRILDDFSTGYRDNVDHDHVELIEGRLQDPGTSATAVSGVDAVLHLGALGSVPRSVADPMTSHLVNATGTLVLLEAARQAGVGHVVCASSSSVYGMNPTLPKDERQWVRPMSPYAVTKLATEQYTLAYQQSFGLETLAFRFFNVYGPGQRAGHAYAAVIPSFLDAIFDGRPITINGDGTYSRDFTFVGTVCDVLLEALVSRKSSPEPVNLAYGTNTSLLDLARIMRDEVGYDFEIEHAPPRPGDVPHSSAANERLLELFPDVAPTPLEVGIRQTVAWFRDRKGTRR